MIQFLTSSTTYQKSHSALQIALQIEIIVLTEIFFLSFFWLLFVMARDADIYPGYHRVMTTSVVENWDLNKLLLAFGQLSLRQVLQFFLQVGFPGFGDVLVAGVFFFSADHFRQVVPPK